MELQAPSGWRCADFISDLHLHAADRVTFAAWAAYMRSTAADAVFILGDLFEVWVGDDAAQIDHSFEAECLAVLQETGARLALFIMQMIFMAVGIFLGCAMKRYKLAASTAISLLLVTYFFSIITALNSNLDFLKYFSPFKYFDPAAMLNQSKLDIVFIGLSAASSL